MSKKRQNRDEISWKTVKNRWKLTWKKWMKNQLKMTKNVEHWAKIELNHEKKNHQNCCKILITGGGGEKCEKLIKTHEMTLKIDQKSKKVV